MQFIILLFLLLAALSKRRPGYLGVFYTNWAEAIQAARSWMSDNIFLNDPQNWTKKIGFLDFLLTPQFNPRTINVFQLRNSEMNDYRSLQIRYTGHDGDSNLIEDDSSSNCNSVAQRRDSLQTVQPTLFAEAKFSLHEDWMLENKEDPMTLQRRVNNELQNATRKLRESIDSQLLSAAGTAVGANPAAGTGAGNYTALSLVSGTDGTIDARYFDVIRNHMEDNYMNGPFGMVGLGEARRYFNRLEVGSVFSDGGIDFSEVFNLYNMAFFKDHFTTASLGGANRVLVFVPGLTQFYQYVMYAGMDLQFNDQDDFIRTTFPDPIYPAITYDYIIQRDDGCDSGHKGRLGVWTHRLFTYFDLYTVEEEAFGDTYGALNDFNGIVGYNISTV